MLKVFVASSNELQAEREALAGCVLRLNRWLVDRGEEERVALEKWEYLDSSMGVDHKQEEYNRALRDSDAALGLCWRKFGQYTEQEVTVAREEIASGRRVKRLEVWFKEAGDGEVSAELASFRERLALSWGVEVRRFGSMDALRALFTEMVLEELGKRGIEPPEREERKRYQLDEAFPTVPKSGHTGNAAGKGDRTLKTVRVLVAAGEELADARRAVEDVLELLNKHFRPQKVEFVKAAEGEEDWAVALYWKDFGGMGQEAFEATYEKFKKARKPVIHVFFKEPCEGVGEALKAFKEAFAERYGHFYCHFETVDAVRFQLAAQSLSMLPGGVGGERDALTVEDGEVRLGKTPVAKMADLPFAKLNAKRKSLVRQIAAAEAEVAGLEEDAGAAPEDADLQEALRDARVKHHDLQEELKKHDGVLFDVAVEFAKTMAEETSERTRKAWALFQQGKVQEANKLLDWDVLKESTERNRTLFRAQRDAFEKNLQEYLAKAKIAMADDSMPMTERVDAASRAYDEAIAIAREIHCGRTGSWQMCCSITPISCRNKTASSPASNCTGSHWKSGGGWRRRARRRTSRTWR